MTGGAPNVHGIIMRRPDGSAMSREEVIIRRRGAFKWLPVFCSNDLVHGSWWFVWGSIVMAGTSIFPLIQNQVSDLHQEDDMLPASDFDLQWSLMIVVGVFFTLGSLAFVRSFDEPPKPPLFKEYKHLQTDELLGAWMFLFGTVPAVPYILIYFFLDPSFLYFVGLVLAIIFVYASWLFVKGCYPTDKETKNFLLPFCMKISGSAQLWAIKHMSTDFLAGTWFFLWGNILLTFICLVLMFIAMGNENSEQIFIWSAGTISSFFFLVGSFYYVSGSYPHATQFYYETNPRNRSGSVVDAHTKDEVDPSDSGLHIPIFQSPFKKQPLAKQEITSTPAQEGPITYGGGQQNKGGDSHLIPAVVKHNFKHQKSAQALGINIPANLGSEFFSPLHDIVPSHLESQMAAVSTPTKTNPTVQLDPIPEEVIPISDPEPYIPQSIIMSTSYKPLQTNEEVHHIDDGDYVDVNQINEEHDPLVSKNEEDEELSLV